MKRKKEKKKEEKREGPGANMVKCPECSMNFARVRDDRSVSCKYCGHIGKINKKETIWSGGSARGELD